MRHVSAGSSMITKVLLWGRGGNVNNGEAVHIWGPKGIWELSVLSPGSCCEPKTDLKSNILTLKT